MAEIRYRGVVHHLISEVDLEEYNLYKKLVKTLSCGRLDGVGHSSKIKLILTCPMYGDEEEVSVEEVLRRIKS